MTNNLLIDQQKAHDDVIKAKAIFDEAKKHEDDAQTALEDANKQEVDAKKKVCRCRGRVYHVCCLQCRLRARVQVPYSSWRGGPTWVVAWIRGTQGSVQRH